MAPVGPFATYTLIFCKEDGIGVATRAAFPDDAAACEHARVRLLRRDPAWVSVVVGRGVDGVGVEVDYIGAWDRDGAGAVNWAPASQF